MAPPGKHRQTVRKDNTNVVQKFIRKYANYEYAESLVFDPTKLPVVSVAILLLEFVLNVFVIQNVRYTEIDWVAYMQEVEGFLNGTTNYALLKGDTGPLVYPAGFVYIYTILYYVTSRGQNIRLAQYIFIGIYLLQMFLVLKLYSKSRKVPPYVLVISAFTSYRIHSIYVLRLFNDPIAILFLYAAINMYVSGKWTLASVLLSLGVSVKMNVLLFAPAILMFYIVNLGYLDTIKQLAICGLVQVVLGLPFLLTYPVEYLKGSFDLGRIFEHKWTVNYRFLPREYFEDRYFHLGLLVLHLILLGVFFTPCYKYMVSYCRLRQLQTQLQPQIDAKNEDLARKAAKKRKTPVKTEAPAADPEPMTVDQKLFLSSFENMLKKNSGGVKKAVEPVPLATNNETPVGQKYEIFFDKAVQLALLPLFLSNFIGVACSRSLHYQFYVWYFHSLPYLVWATDYKNGLRFLLMGLIEFSWNTYPSTVWSSIILHISHAVLLFGIGRNLYKSQNEPKFKVN